MRRGGAGGKSTRVKVIEKVSLPEVRLRIAIGSFIALFLGGTLGYHFFEHWSFLDSIFMTVITLSSVGYGEVHDLDITGQVFTVILISVGVGITAWALFTTFEVLVSEQGIRAMEKRRLRRLIHYMKNHFIVCGYGRIGAAIVKGYKRNGIPFVVIDPHEATIEKLREAGIPYVQGDASNDSVLEEAGLARARGLIAATESDANTTFVVLTARQLKPDLMIVARADYPDNIGKLYRAGANKVVSPHVLGGWWMSVTAINPAATDFMQGLSNADQSKISLFEFRASQSCHGKKLSTMAFREHTGVLVLSVRRGEVFSANPPDSLVLEVDDYLIALGSPEQLKKMAKLCDPDNPVAVDLVFEVPGASM